MSGVQDTHGVQLRASGNWNEAEGKPNVWVRKWNLLVQTERNEVLLINGKINRSSEMSF